MTDWRNAMIEEAAKAIRQLETDGILSGALPDFEGMARAALAVFEKAHTPNDNEREALDYAIRVPIAARHVDHKPLWELIRAIQDSVLGARCWLPSFRGAGDERKAPAVRVPMPHDAEYEAHRPVLCPDPAGRTVRRAGALMAGCRTQHAPSGSSRRRVLHRPKRSHASCEVVSACCSRRK